MKNRILDLCIKNGIETTIEFARLVGCSESVAYNIMMQKQVIPYEILERCSTLFNVSKEYIACVI